MKLNTMKTYLSIIAIATTISATTASATINLEDVLGEKNAQKISVAGNKFDLAKEIVETDSVDTKAIAKNTSSLWGGLTQTAGGLWAVTKGVGGGLYNVGTVVVGAGEAVYGAGNYAVGYVGSMQNWKDYGSEHMTEGRSLVAKGVKALPGNACTIGQGVVETVSGVSKVIEAGEPLLEDAQKISEKGKLVRDVVVAPAA